MTPLEKAKDLVQQMINKVGGEDFEQLSRGKSCALIAIDEIMKGEPLEPFYGDYYETIDDRLNYVAAYWHKVKEEINKL